LLIGDGGGAPLKV